MRALAKLFEISCVLLAVVTLIFLAAAADSNAPRQFHERYIHASLLWGGATLVSLTACLLCKARLKKKQKPTPDTPLKGERQPPAEPLP